MIRYGAASSVKTDAYQAGDELGTQLRVIAPEAVILFASINYAADFAALFEGLGDALEPANRPVVFGCTGDGVYATDRVSHHGVSALAIQSGGTVRWTTTVVTGASADSLAAGRVCAERARAAAGPDAQLGFLLADGIGTDGSRIAAGASAALPFPFLGGLAGDDRQFARSYIFADGRVWQDAVALLVAAGPLSFRLNAASGWQPTGASGHVEEVQGRTLLRISGRSPSAFVREQLGKTPGEVDLGLVPLATYPTDAPDHFYLRTPSHIDPATGAMTTFGSIEPGSLVRVCTATRADVLRGAEQALSGAQAGAQTDAFVPAAALIVSCAGRKWLLEDHVVDEVERVFASTGSRLPLAGFPSFGEMGPFRLADGRYTPTFFHNVTFVACLLGA